MMVGRSTGCKMGCKEERKKQNEKGKIKCEKGTELVVKYIMISRASIWKICSASS